MILEREFSSFGTCAQSRFFEKGPVYGLYCGLAPLLAYGALGSSAHLSIGPFALVSLLTREAAENVCLASGRCDDDDDAGYVAAVLALSLATGLWQLALAGLGAGTHSRE